MEKYHITVESTGGTIMEITRKVLDIKDAVELAFEEAVTEASKIVVIDLEFIEE